MLPLCASTMDFAIASPRPIPSCFVVKNASNTFESASGATPLSGVRHDDLDAVVDTARIQQEPTFLHVATVHRVHRVQEKTEQHLLKANAIGSDRRQRVLELRLDQDAPTLCLTAEEAQRVVRDVVHVERMEQKRALAHEPADPLDDVGGPASRADDVAQYLAEHPAHGAAVAALEHTESGAGIADDGRQRLCDLVPDRRGEPPDEHEAGRVRQLLARGSELRLRVPQLRDVMAAIEPRAAVDRYGLHADGHHPPLTVLDRHLVPDVADLAATPELARGEQAPAEE